MRNAGLDEAQAGIKIAGRNINNLRYADDTIVMAENKEELKSLLLKVKEESEKLDLKLDIQKTKIMASSPITSWQIDGETMETVRDFILGGSKIMHSSTLAWKIPWMKEAGRLYPWGHKESDMSEQLHFHFYFHSHPYMTTGKTRALTTWTFVGKVMSLLSNMLSRLVIAFLPRSKHLLISWLQSPSAVIWEPKKIKSVTVFIVSPSICHEVMGPDAMISVF